MPIKFGPEQNFTVGPFKSVGTKKLEHTFRLFYFNSNSEIKYFGPRFGFSVPVVEYFENKKPLDNTFRNRINAVIKKTGSRKSVEYILERLKEMGINESNFTECSEIIEEITRTL